MADETIIGNWDYHHIGVSEPAIVITLKLRIPNAKIWSSELELLVDTGYDGEVLLSDELYSLAGYSKISFPETQWSKAQSITGGIIRLTRCNTLVLVGNDEFDVIVESHSSIQENIIGRGFINRFTSLLEGTKSRWTLKSE